MGNEFWAAIIGAIIGGLIALGIQLLALRAAKNQRLEEAAERKKALAHALLFKMAKILSNLENFKEYLQGPLKIANEAKLEREPWELIQPLANYPDPIQFSTDEMAMLLSLKNDDLFNEILSMDQVHNATIQSFQTLSKERLELTSQLPTEMEGRVGKVVLDDQQKALFVPRMIGLNGLIMSMLSFCKKDSQEAHNILIRLQTTFKEQLGLSYSINMTRAEASPEEHATRPLKENKPARPHRTN